jgi:hypothetical protein
MRLAAKSPHGTKASGAAPASDSDAGQPLDAPLTGQTDQGYGVAFSPDVHRLAI